MIHLNEPVRRYDVIVVGGGHAGVEAALAASRLGCHTLLITSNLDTIGKMSCNPAIGGVAKGQIVREIDALGGEMGLAADHTGIHFRLLNTKKGPAVWAPRAQCDRIAYQMYLKSIVESQENLVLRQGLIDDLIVEDDTIKGIITNTQHAFLGMAVILTTGTFLRGVIHVGDCSYSGGRLGEPAANSLTARLTKLGFDIRRFKTGTPPRIHKNSIDFSELHTQYGDEPPCFFSYRTPSTFHVEQIPCYITHTTLKTSELIRKNLHFSPLYSGKISGIGPRYCPSIEDKIVKFSEKEHHQIFLEPEGLSTSEFYVNGASTSLPEEIQQKIIRSIKGLEHAEIMRPAYAIEYDCVLPYQLHSTLETKRIANLYLAGQINGTSGYEEAAGQGLIAGINSAHKVQNKSPFLLRRSDAYIGVMIDDLVTKGVDEPYRMFTSRAEYRLLLRQDNADLRLTSKAYEIGLIGSEQWKKVQKKKELIDFEKKRLRIIIEDGQQCADILKRPDVSYDNLKAANTDLSIEVKRQIEIQIKYEGYIRRDLEEILRLGSLDEERVPAGIDYHKITALAFESRQKLSQFLPDTIGQASRIPGVTPADIVILRIWIRKGKHRSTC